MQPIYFSKMKIPESQILVGWMLILGFYFYFIFDTSNNALLLREKIIGFTLTLLESTIGYNNKELMALTISCIIGLDVIISNTITYHIPMDNVH